MMEVCETCQTRDIILGRVAVYIALSSFDQSWECGLTTHNHDEPPQHDGTATPPATYPVNSRQAFGISLVGLLLASSLGLVSAGNSQTSLPRSKLFRPLAYPDSFVSVYLSVSGD
ncbi:hypothetical protein EV368DRAFT_90197 [Lentinula lateritia]|nr:hypothetical protein EV368DRAFT_90197 [Lentinula lateritia]